MKNYNYHHEHNHHHEHEINSLNRSFIIGIILNAGFVIVEFIAGFLFNSMGLLSDAGHNLSDVTSLVLAMVAFKLTKVNANSRYTYGYKKSTIIVSFLNAVILLMVVIMIIIESIEKLFNPQPVEGYIIVWVAAFGIIINVITAWLFIKDKDRDLNIKGTYIHMAMDALVSVGVVLSGFIILFTGLTFIDSIIGLIIAIIIIFSTWNLLKSSIRLVLDGVPKFINSEEISKKICECFGVLEVHHLHIWAISTTENALTSHIVVKDIKQIEKIKNNIKHILSENKISHVTLEFELVGCLCIDKNCRNEKK